MKQRWINFWKLRRQQDSVKFVLLFAAAGVIFLAQCAIAGTQLYGQANQPSQYILENQAGVAFTERQIASVQALELTQAVTLQQTYPVTLENAWGEASLTCCRVSRGWLEDVCGISERSAMPRLYLNSAAVDLLWKTLHLENKDDLWNHTVTGSWSTGAENSAASDSKNVPIQLLPGTEPMEAAAPWGYWAGDDIALSEQAAQLRVLTDGPDLDGAWKEAVLPLGLSVQNETEAQEATFLWERTLLSLKYKVLAAVICFLAAGCLWHYGVTITY